METPALSRAVETINQGRTPATELLINFDELDHVPAETVPTDTKPAEQSELIPSDMNAFISNYLARQLPHHVSNAKMIQWLTAVMHVDSHVFELMLNCKHCKLSHVTYCFQLNTCEQVKPHLLTFLKRKIKDLLDEQGHVTEWSELVDMTRVTMLAIERWGEEALEALVDSPSLPILVRMHSLARSVLTSKLGTIVADTHHQAADTCSTRDTDLHCHSHARAAIGCVYF